MGKENKGQREFLDNIDKLLVGKDIEDNEGMSEEYRSTIQFARKLTDASVKPSPEFKERLKKRLVLQLVNQAVAEREKVRSNGFWEVLQNLVPQSPVWRTAAATLVVAIVAVSVMWRTGMFTETVMPESEQMLTESLKFTGAGEDSEAMISGAMPETEEAEEEVTRQTVLGLETTEVITARYGEEIRSELTFVNNSAEAITINRYPPLINIVAGKTLRPVYSIPSGETSVTLLPSEATTYTLIWNQRTGEDVQVESGWYNIIIGGISITSETDVDEVFVNFEPSPQIFIEAQ